MSAFSNDANATPPVVVDDEEEDWERIDERIAALNISQRAQIAAASTQSIQPVQPKVLLRPACSQTPPPPSLFVPASAQRESDVEVDDPALLSVMSDPRQRMVLLQIEDALQRFVSESDEKSLVFPPGMNGFHRLLVYRVAERFGLAHASSDELCESGERGVVVFKTLSTALPRKLLIDVDVSAEHSPAPTAAVTTAVSANESSAAAAAPPKKAVKMMVRRRETASDKQRNTQSERERERAAAQSVEDRERAYNAARARIFGEEESGTPGAAQGADSAKEKEKDKERAREKEKEKERAKERVSPALESSTSSSSKKVVDVSSWRESESRSVLRSAETEKTDPDFARLSLSRSLSSRAQRGSYGYSQGYGYGAAPPPAGYVYGNAAYGGRGGGGAGGGAAYGTAYAQQQQGYGTAYGTAYGTPENNNPYYAAYGYQEYAHYGSSGSGSGAPNGSPNGSQQQPFRGFSASDFPPL